MKCSVCKNESHPHYEKVRGEYVCGTCLCRYHKKQDIEYWGDWIPAYEQDSSTTASILLRLREHLEWFLLRNQGNEEVLEELLEHVKKLGKENDNSEWDD